MKKMVVLVIALVMVFTMAVPASAASAPVSSSISTNSIHINDGTNANNSVTGYKLTDYEHSLWDFFMLMEIFDNWNFVNGSYSRSWSKTVVNGKVIESDCESSDSASSTSKYETIMNCPIKSSSDIIVFLDIASAVLGNDGLDEVFAEIDENGFADFGDELKAGEYQTAVWMFFVNIICGASDTMMQSEVGLEDFANLMLVVWLGDVGTLHAVFLVR